MELLFGALFCEWLLGRGGQQIFDCNKLPEVLYSFTSHNMSLHQQEQEVLHCSVEMNLAVFFVLVVQKGLNRSRIFL